MSEVAKQIAEARQWAKNLSSESTEEFWTVTKTYTIKNGKYHKLVVGFPLRLQHLANTRFRLATTAKRCR